jgi:hypothetical protein
MKRRINQRRATQSTLMRSRVIHFMIVPPNASPTARLVCERLLGPGEGLVHNHPRDWFTVLFLLRRVNTVGLRIDGETVDSMLDAKVFELAVMIWIVLMENGQGAAVARDIDAAKTAIEFDDIRSVGKRQKGDCGMLVQIEDGH